MWFALKKSHVEMLLVQRQSSVSSTHRGPLKLLSLR